MTDQVTNRQLFFIIVITLVGFSIIELPKSLAESSGRGAWITLIIASISFGVLAAILAYLGYLFQGKTLFEYSQLLVGKLLASFFVMIYLVYFTIILAFLNRSAAEVIKTDLLIKTPIWYTMLFMLIFSGYAASKGITNVGRILEYYGVIIIFLAICIHIAMFFQGDLIDIKPFYNSAEKIKYFTALPEVIIAFLGFEVLSIIPFSRHNGKKAVVYVIGAMLFVGLFYILIVETSFMVLSVEDTKNYKNTLIAAMRRVEIKHLQFLVRLDIIFFMAWIFALFSTFTVVTCTAAGLLKKLFPSLKRQWNLIVILVVAYMLGVLPSTRLASQILTVTTKNLGLVPAGVIPIILFVIAKVKRYG
ncbi:MAG: spore gernimation protein [Firmicutes bacterium HGW-Firmicutes-7]|nr:MAG: spore gernimation protein [Firmicutes bacterium HGW-Firmicutes-7]